MPLSTESVKNLIAVLLSTSLLMTAISLGLISNVVVALNDLTIKARNELRDLLVIQGETPNLSLDDLLLQSAKTANLNDVANWEVRGSIDPNAEILTDKLSVDIKLPAFVPAGLVLPSTSNNTNAQSAIEAFSQLCEKQDYAIGNDFDLEYYQMLWDTLAKTRYLLVVNPKKTRIIFCYIDDDLQTVSLGKPMTTTTFSRSSLGTRIPGFDSFSISLTISSVVLTNGGEVSGIGFNIPMRHYLIEKTDQISFRPPLDVLDKLKKLQLQIQVQTELVNAEPLKILLGKIARIGLSRAEADSFANAFPNLTNLGKQYRSLRLPDLDAILADESKRSKGTLEIFGVKIPSEAVVWLGLPSLGAILWQFGMVARYIDRRATSLGLEEASEWSFLLREPALSLFGIGTTVALPLTATILSISFVTTETWYRWLLWPAIAVLICLGCYVSASSLLSLRRRVVEDMSLSPNDGRPNRAP
jgi:hypothetical protein